ncbi:MAG TPA: nuclear transport factor 2 family protein [Sphingomicrobium sp.]|nr:nuclear transport factor 2 family protein [Sphingomicrobium sp.]
MPVAAALLVLALAAAPAAAASLSPEAQELAALNERVLRAYALGHDSDGYAALAHPRYKIVVEPGLIENRDMAVKGVGNLSFNRFDVTTRSVDIVGDSAIVITTIEAEGRVGNQAFPPRMTMMHFFTREGGEWRLLGRSMTPIQVPPDIFERFAAEALAPPE